MFDNISFFRLLGMSALGFTEREDSFAYSPAHVGFTFGTTPVNLLATSLAACPVSHLDTCRIASLSPWFKCVKGNLGNQVINNSVLR